MIVGREYGNGMWGMGGMVLEYQLFEVNEVVVNG